MPGCATYPMTTTPAGSTSTTIPPTTMGIGAITTGTGARPSCTSTTASTIRAVSADPARWRSTATAPDTSFLRATATGAAPTGGSIPDAGRPIRITGGLAATTA